MGGARREVCLGGHGGRNRGSGVDGCTSWSGGKVTQSSDDVASIFGDALSCVQSIIVMGNSVNTRPAGYSRVQRSCTEV